MKIVQPSLTLVLCLLLCVVDATSWELSSTEDGQDASSLQPSGDSPPRDPPEVIWFGGDDGNGVAVEGGTWTWDDVPPGWDPLQGWISIDDTANPADYYQRVDEDVFLSHGDPVVPMFPGSEGQLWCGIHEDEALSRDFVTGMGYQNLMCQWTYSPEHPIDPIAQDVAISFLYCNDSEIDYDFTHLYLVCFDGGGAEIDQYEVDAFTGVIGTPDVPETYQTIVPAGSLDPATATVRLALKTTSDPAWSDQDGLYDSENGPFMVDDVSLALGEDIFTFDFEDGPQGWTFQRCPGVGHYMGLIDEDTYAPWLDEMEPSGDCSGLMGNVLELNDEAGSPYDPPGHPVGQRELAISGTVARGNHPPEVWDLTRLRFDEYWYCRMVYGSYVSIGYLYYPYTTPENPAPRWSPRNYPWYYFGYNNQPQCLSPDALMPDVPTEWDSLRVFFEIYTSCESFGVPPSLCTEEGNAYGGPLFDNVRVGLNSSNPSSVPPQAHAGADPGLRVAPNPSPGGATLSFDLPQAENAIIEIYDAAGRCLRILPVNSRSTGQQTLSWDGCDSHGTRVPSGSYYFRLTVAGQVRTERMILLE